VQYVTKIDDLKGFSYPLTPRGISSVVGDLPWHFGTEFLNIVYRTDPQAVAAFLPEPLAPGDEPDRVCVSFSKWWSLWDNQPDMPFINPERTWYTETVVWVICSYRGQQGQLCVLTWVDNDFTMARGHFMGFPKKFGKTYKSDYNPMNPRMEPIGPGTKMKGYIVAHGERLIEGTLEIQNRIPVEELPKPMGLPVYNIRHFPNIVPGVPPSVLELVRLNAENVHFGDVWRGDATIHLFPSEIEEHTLLAPKEVIGGYFFTGGSTITGGELLHSWV
jgi:acetoacetate decarboxylase